MRNFDIRKIKKSARFLISSNGQTVYSLALVMFFINLAVSVFADLLNINGGFGLLPALLSLVLTAPLQIGQMSAYYRMSKGESMEPKAVLREYYKDGKKRMDSFKTVGFYWLTLLMWFTVYVLFPMGVCYMIWGKSLMSGDSVFNFAMVMVVFTAVAIVAALPYFIHMLRFSGGLFYAAQGTHMGVRARFDVGKTVIAPHVYRYALMTVTFLIYILLSYGPYILGGIMFSENGAVSALLTLFGNFFRTVIFMPYYNMASMLMFERMQNPKKEMDYVLK